MFPDKHTKKPVGVGSPSGYKDKEMEMDKIIKTLMAAAVLALMSACVRHETEDPDLGPTDNISMFPQMEDVSRSVINSTKELESHQIGVFGYKSASGGHQLIFDNKTLYYDAVWKYSGTRYWERRAGYWFAAYVPFMGTSGSGTYVSESQTGGATSDHTLTIHNIPKWQTADQDAKDIMTALSSNSAAWYLENNAGVVDLKFRHILSQLVIKAYSVSEGSEFKVTGISIGANRNGRRVPDTGSYDYQLNYTSGSASYSVQANSYGVEILTDGAKIPYLNDTDKKAAQSLIVSHKLVAPFISDATGTEKIPITVSYTQDGYEQNPVTISLGISQMEQSKTYLLYIEFKDSGNKISALDIQTIAWTDVIVDDSNFHNW